MNPMIVTLGPLLGADADGISTAQLPPGAFGMAINGSLSSGFSADSIAEAQTAAAAGDLVLDGVTVSDDIAQLGVPSYVAITSVGDDSAITFTVSGILYGPNGYGGASQVETVTGSNASVVVTTQLFSVVTAVSVSDATADDVSVGVNGSATLDFARKIAITTTANDASVAFDVIGTAWNNNPIHEVVQGADTGTSVTRLDFKTVQAIVPSAAPAGNVTIGTNGIASTRPVFFDPWTFAPWTMQTTVTGSANYTVSFSMDDPNEVGLVNVNWVDCTVADFVNASAGKYSGFANTPRVMRMTLNSGSGSVKLTAIQNANVPL